MKPVISFNLLSDNEYWSILKEANDFHVKRRDRHQQLLDLLKAKGVAFKDIKAHLMNQAKKAGLYTRSLWSDSTKQMEFRSYSDLLKCNYAWVISLDNFLKWTKANYREYGVEVTRVARPNDKPVVEKKTTLRRTTSPDGTVKEDRTETTEIKEYAPIDPVLAEAMTRPPEPVVPAAPVAPVPDHIMDNAQFMAGGQSIVAPESSILAPVTETLTALQIETIVLQNISILGKIAKKHSPDALQYFNDLMATLGVFEEIIEPDPIYTETSSAVTAAN